MPYQAHVFNVMIASPGDVQVERNIAREVIHEWNAIHSTGRRLVLQPLGWETHAAPSMADRPQGIINKQVLEKADLLVAVFWTRLGTPTGVAASGTVEEIAEHIKAGKPVMIYFSSVPVRPDSVDEKQYGALRAFKADCEKRGLIETFETPTEFRQKFARHLATTLNEHSYFQKYTGATQTEGKSGIDQRPPIPDISKEATQLLLDATQDSQGTILHIVHLGGVALQTNGKEFIEPNNARSRALWEGAMAELEQKGLIEDLGHKREIFQVTRQGYELADILKIK